MLSPEEAYDFVAAGHWPGPVLLACEAWAADGARSIEGELVPLEILDAVVGRLQADCPVLRDPTGFDAFVMGLGFAQAQGAFEPQAAQPGELAELIGYSPEASHRSREREVRGAVESWLQVDRRLRGKLLRLALAAKHRNGQRLHELCRKLDPYAQAHLLPLLNELRRAAGLKPKWSEGPLQLRHLREINKRLIVLMNANKHFWMHYSAGDPELLAGLAEKSDLDYLAQQERAGDRWASDREVLVKWRGELSQHRVINWSLSGMAIHWDRGQPPPLGARLHLVRGKAQVPAKVMNCSELPEGAFRLGLLVQHKLTTDALGF